MNLISFSHSFKLVYKSSILYISILLFLISATYFYLFGNGLFFFQEGKMLFIYSGEYFNDFWVKPGGILDYVGNFLTQGYFNNICGSLIISIFPVMLFIVLIKINKRLSIYRSFSLMIVIIPSCLLFLLQTNYEHFIHHSLGFLFVLMWFYLSIDPGKKRQRYVYLAFYPVLFYLTGFFSLIFSLIYIIYSLIYEEGLKKLLVSLFFLVFVLLTFVVSKDFIFYQTTEKLLVYPFCINDISNFYPLVYVFCIYISLFPLVVKISDLIRINEYKLWNYLITLVILFPVTLVLLFKYYDADKAELMRIEKMVVNHDWDSIIEYHEKFSLTTLVGQYYYNLALSEKGILCDRLFFGRQDFGSKAIYLPRDKEHINSTFYFYYCIGLNREAHHLAYQSMVLFGYQPENAKMLVKTELINGNYRIAQKYIDILKNTMHYRKWASEYECMLENPKMILADEELGKKVRLLPGRDFFISSGHIFNIESVLLANPDNKRAFEYKLAGLLLDKNFEAVVYQIKKMGNMGYNFLPRHLEEAIVLFEDFNIELPYLGEIEVRDETKLRFEQFKMNYGTSFNNGIRSLKGESIINKEESTLWYYLKQSSE